LFLMKKNLPLRLAVPALSLLATTSVSLAHAQSVETNPVVVTASRITEPLADVLPSVSVITRRDIEKTQAQTLADLLQGEAGVEFGRNGGPGSVTSFFLRGQNSVNTVIMIDGVRTQVDGGGNLTVTDLPLDMVERIEVLRGNASALYGEAAIGGVINIMTRRSQGLHKAYANIEAGSSETRRASVGYGGAADDLNYDFQAGKNYTKGLSAIDASVKPNANPDRDGSETTFGNVRFEKRLNADRQLGLRLNAKSTNTDFDSESGSANDTHRYKTRTEGANLFWRERISEQWLSQLDFSYAHFANDSLKNNTVALSWLRTPNGEYRGRQNSLRWFNTYALQPTSTLNFGLDHSDESYEQLNTYAAKRKLMGYFAGLNHKQDRWTWQFNARHDSVSLDRTASGAAASKDNTASSYLLGLGYALTSQWRATASVSTGFRTPTADELMGYGGTLSLSPEKHKTEELGVTFQHSQTLTRLVYFRTRSENAITWTGGGNCYADCYTNIGETRNQGLELSVRTQWAGNAIRLSAVSQAPWNVSDNTVLLRRAKRYGSVDVSRPLGVYEVGTRLYAASARTDFGNVNLPGYALLSFYASRRLDNNWTVRARLDNALDTQYRLVDAYNTAGRGLFFTLQYSPK
jgi:vitamin B12 transporter